MADELEPRGGPARGYSWPPFEPGNQASLRSGFYLSPALREEHRAEVEALAESLAAALPDYNGGTFGVQVAQLALKLWRQGRAYAYLAERGLTREDGSAQPLLVDLAKLENGIARDLDALGLNPRSRAALGLDVARAESELERYLAAIAAEADGA